GTPELREECSRVALQDALHQAQLLVERPFWRPIIMRDDIDSLNIPASGKRYARMRGINVLKGSNKQKLYTRMVSKLVNGGRAKGFPNRDVVGPVRMAS